MQHCVLNDCQACGNCAASEKYARKGKGEALEGLIYGWYFLGKSKKAKL